MSNTNVTGCFAQGSDIGTNVFVSGGGLHVQASSSLVLKKCVFTHCSIRDAFSEFIPSGGGALGTLNVSNISISGSSFLNNLDSSGTGSLFLQQLQPADSLGTYAQVPLRDEEEAHILNLSLSSVFIW